MPARSASASSASSRAIETAASRTNWRWISSRARAARGQVGLERDAAALQRADERRSAGPRRATATSGSAGCTFDASTSCRRRPRGTPRRSRRRAARAVCASMLARSSASVSNSLAARASSSSTGGRIFSCTSRTVTSTVPVLPSPR